jgi:hypothetical protein
VYQKKLPAIFTQMIAMKTIATPVIQEEVPGLHYGPAVTIVMPFEPKMQSKEIITKALRKVLDKVEEELLENYCDDMGMLVLQKLKTVVNHLNFSTFKKSVAIYISPFFEKLLYLDFEVEERLSIEPSFKIRDLVNNRKSQHQYLVLFVSGKQSHIYQGNAGGLKRIVSNTPESFYPTLKQFINQEAMEADLVQMKHRRSEAFLKRIDNALHTLLNTNECPLYVVGPENIVSHFKKITKHAGLVIDYLTVPNEEASLKYIRSIIEPEITDWKKVYQTFLVNRVKRAQHNKRLAMGPVLVWKQTLNRKGKLLVIEENFTAKTDGEDAAISLAIGHYSKYSYIQDLVDEIIERVLENGGEVEFVPEGSLREYHQIALVF